MKQYIYIKSLILLSGLLMLMNADLSAQSYLSERFKDVENVRVSIWNGKEVAHKEQKIHIKLREGVGLESVLGQSLLSADEKSPPNVLGWSVLRLDSSADLMDAIQLLRTYPDVLEAEPLLVGETGNLPNDPDLYRQWALRNTGQAPTNGTPGADISAQLAWNITTGSEDVVVAVLDTGIPLVQHTTTLSHPDLQNTNRIILGPNFSDSPGNVRDENGHGTHVAGIVGAETNNSTGIAGTTWE
ncbi:Subtilase family protein [Cyclonatronum proteinivorum]|uniref:Subtilase family protein n=1 Tax=Cyclonatronum proteinivorum TaxID=1457365 RepID=A0A345UNU4_9BACT|nr:S8 family serine peptidase [Cyclonatronum proteinivorum]AXJ02146.1 Subtilase family protein [Cyclonatronum proteinivorum]